MMGLELQDKPIPAASFWANRCVLATAAKQAVRAAKASFENDSQKKHALKCLTIHDRPSGRVEGRTVECGFAGTWLETRHP